MPDLTPPHGADTLKPLYVDDPHLRGELEREAANLPALTISSAAAANAVMLAAGYFTPLTGFVDKNNALSVAQTMHTSDGLFWPTPVLNLVESAGSIMAGDRIALRDPNVAGETAIAMTSVISLPADG